MTNSAPSPSVLRHSIVPPSFVISPKLSDSPSPVPTPGSLVVKNGSKIFSRSSAGMPLPVSRI